MAMHVMNMLNYSHQGIPKSNTTHNNNHLYKMIMITTASKSSQPLYKAQFPSVALVEKFHCMFRLKSNYSQILCLKHKFSWQKNPNREYRTLDHSLALAVDHWVTMTRWSSGRSTGS